MNSLGVHIKVKDFARSEKFYKDLGFEKVFEYGPNKSVVEDYSGAVFDVGGAQLEIADGHRAVKKEVFSETVKSSKISLMIGVEKLSNVIEVCNKVEIDIAVKPRHYYWGKLELVIRDPDGVILVFWAKYDEVEAKKILADEAWMVKDRLPA
ncbi:VOC family protein [Candidatus Shapirobacteria bacterium]|nr:VOC family protein [Candidatus Shapirobacteria bacterium]